MANEAVRQLMSDNRLPVALRTYLVGTLNMDTLARVHNAFTEALLDTAVNDVLTANGYHPAGTPEQVRTARTVGGDLKQFWREAAAQNNAAIDRKSKGVDETPM